MGDSDALAALLSGLPLLAVRVTCSNQMQLQYSVAGRSTRMETSKQLLRFSQLHILLQKASPDGGVFIATSAQLVQIR